MSLQFNPQSAYNGMISGHRNMFLSSSIAFVILGFSDKFTHKRIHFLIQLFGLGLLMLSIGIGFKSNYDLQLVLDNLYKENKVNNKHHDFILNEFSSWKWVVYIYATLLCLLIIMYSMRKMSITMIRKK